MKKLYNLMFEPIKNVCRKSAGRNVILMAAILFSSYQGWGQASVVSISGAPCGTGSLMLASSIQPARIIWFNGIAPLTVNATWNPAGTTVAGGNGAGAGLNQLSGPNSLYRDAAGNVYIAEFLNNRVIEFPSGSTSATNGTIVAGTGTAGSTAATLKGPAGVWVDASGNIFVADAANNRIQEFAPGAPTAGTTVAGLGSTANSTLSSPEGIQLDAAGNLYVVDEGNNRVIEFASGSTAGSTGTVVAGGNGSGSGATQLNSPTGLFISAAGNLYVADFGNNRVQDFGAVTTSTSTTSATTVAGGNGNGSAANQLNNPTNVYVDGLGNIYVADAYNNRIQQWAAGATTGTTVAGSAAGTSGATASLLSIAYTVTLDGNGNIYTSDYSNSRVQEFTPTILLTYNDTAAGIYTAAVTTFTGAVSTTNVDTVRVAPTLTGSPVNDTICAGANATFSGSGTGTNLLYQWQVSNNNGTSYTFLTNTPPYSGVNTPTLTVTGAATTLSGKLYQLIISGSCTPYDTTVGAKLVVDSLIAITSTPTTKTICAIGNNSTGNTTFTAAANGTGPITYQWQVSTNSGTSYTNLTNTGIYTNDTTGTLTITGATTAVNGNLYRVVATGHCGTATSIADTLNVTALPAISAQPAPVTVCANGNADFSITATGVAGHQWQVSANGGTTYTNLTNGVPTTGATTATLSLSGVSANMSGYLYRDSITNAGGCSMFSNSVALTVDTLPVVTTAPANDTVCAGSTATFTALGAGTGISYQWQLSTDGGINYNNIASATSTSYTTVATTAAMNGYLYKIVVSGTCAPAATAFGILNVEIPPAIAAAGQPVNDTVCAGSTATFMVTATGNVLSYQWQRSTNGGTSFTNITGQTSDTLILTGVTAARNNDRYRAYIVGPCTPTDTSNGAKLIIDSLPSITSGPTPAMPTVCAGSGNSVTIRVVATGTNIRYQWQISPDNSAGSYTNVPAAGVYSNTMTAALTITAPPTTLNGFYYRLRVSGTCTPVAFSTPAMLTVNTSPVIAFSPVTPVCFGTSTIAIPFTGLSGSLPTSAPVTQNFLFTGSGPQTFTVPAGTTSITFDAAGARGGTTQGGTSATAATGGRVQGTIPVTAGQVLNIYVGGEGVNGSSTGLSAAGGFNGGGTSTAIINGTGGGGGGASDIRIGGTALTNRFVVAGGGGGNGRITAGIIAGGAGGNTTAAAGTDAATDATGGGGGTATAGGTGGAGTYRAGLDGASGTGGNSNIGAGAGGGGYFGGGGGGTSNATAAGGGGGGGSSYTDPSITGVVNTPGYDTSNGYVTLNYIAVTPAAYTYSIVWSATAQTAGFAAVTNQPFPSTAAALNIPIPGGATGGTYTGTLTLSNAGCSATFPISITVTAAPGVTQPPANTYVCTGGNATIAVTGSGGGPLTYSWAVSTNNGTSFSAITAATTPAVYSGYGTNALTITGATAGLNGTQYRVTVSGACTPATVSNADTFHISTPVAATALPASTVGCVGSNVTIPVTTTGGTGGPITYQWNVNTGSGFTPIAAPAGTTNPLILTGVTAAMSGYVYNVTVMGSCNTVTSTNETLNISTIIPATPVAQPLTLDSFCIAGGVPIVLTASGASAGGYYVVTGPNNFSYISQSASSIVVNGTAAAVNSGTYVIYDSLNGCISPSVNEPVVVSIAPTVTAGLVTPAVCYGQTANFFTNISTVYPIAPNGYVWSGPVNATQFTPNSPTHNPIYFSDSVDANPQKVNVNYTDSGSGYTFTLLTQFGSQVCVFGINNIHLTVNPLPATPVVAPGNHLDSVCLSSPISLIASSATGGVSYSWTSPTDVQSNATYTQAKAKAVNGGHYSVIATVNTTGCASAPDTLFLLVKQTPGNPHASSNSPVCIGAPLDLMSTASMADSFSWTGPNSYIASVQNPVIVSTPPSAAGTYTVTAYDQGCASLQKDSVTVTTKAIPPDPTAVQIFTTPFCEGADIVLQATDSVAGLSYHWTTGNIYAPHRDSSNLQDWTITSPPLIDSGTYIVHAYLPPGYLMGGCASANPGVVQVVITPRPPTPTLTTNSPICDSSTLHLFFDDGTSTIAGQALWSGPAFNASALPGSNTSSTPSFAGAPLVDSGDYFAFASYNGCLSLAQGTVHVSILPTPKDPILTSNSPVCSGPGNTIKFSLDTIAGSGPGPLSYIWTGPGGGFSNMSRTPTIPNPTAANTGIDSVYTVNTYGCRSLLPGVTTVIVNPSPAAPIIGNQVLCQFSPVGPLMATGTNLLWYSSATAQVGSPVAPVPNDSLPGVFDYYVSQSSGLGCEGPRAVSVITVNQQPTPPAVNSNTINYCQFDNPAVLSATGQNLLWYTTATGGAGTPIAPIPSTAAPANYVYYVSQSINGCESDRQPITVIVHLKPQPPLVQDDTYCQNDNATPLVAIGQNPRWYNVAVGGVGTPIAPIPQTSYPDTTIYYVTQTVNGCESDRVPEHVYVFYKPNVVIKTPAGYVCQHDTMSFFYFGNALPSAAFDWGLPQGASIIATDGPDRITVRFDSAGNQNLFLTVSNGNCKSVSNILVVQVRPQPFAFISSKHDVCQDDIVVVGLVDQSTGTQFYNYNFDNGTIISSASPGGPYNIQWTTPGIHIVDLTTTLNTCTSLPARDTVNVHPIPDAHIIGVNAADLNNICSGDSVEVAAGLVNAGYQYQWSPVEFFNHGNNEPSLYANIEFSGNIYLKVTSDFGCVGNDSAFVNIQPCCNLYLPNAFTPNGDGKNDIFHILTIGHHTIRDFRIVNRWGETIFQTNDETVGWDGKYKGVPQDMDTYFYFVDYVCEPGDKEMKTQGEILLVR